MMSKFRLTLRYDEEQDGYHADLFGSSSLMADDWLAYGFYGSVEAAKELLGNRMGFLTEGTFETLGNE